MRTAKILGTLSLASSALLALLVSGCSGDSSSNIGGGSGNGGTDSGAGTGQTGGVGGGLFETGGDTNGVGGTGGSGTIGSGGTGVGTGGVGAGGVGAAGAAGGGSLTDAQVDSGRADAAIADASGPVGDGQAGADAGKKCGNGVVDPGEDCDPGTGPTSAICTPSCHWLCSPGAAGDAFCDDHQPCDGTETCSADHACIPGKSLANGTSCGAGMVCKTGLCASPSCGDSVRTDPEECDDGNAINGDGCDTNCKFSCVSTDGTRDCTALQTPCVNTISCNDGTHVCSTPASKADNTVCGTHNYCKTGVCVAATCGNGKVEPTEDCDDGNATNGDGCNDDCTFSCVNPSTDCVAAPSCKKQSCDLQHACSPVADGSKDDTSCGAGQVCASGACVNACGNGIVDSGEQCDDGNNADGDGCQHNCVYTCATPATDCTTAPPSCDKWTCNANSHLCDPVADPTKNDAACGSGLACNSGGKCVNACGNGILDPGEQCDDGNNIDGDGCQHNCVDTCANPTTDCAGSAGTCSKWSCDANTHKCAAVTDTGQNGTSCGAGQVCTNGACGNSCGNHVVDPGEQCDDGNQKNGDGCDTNCQFSCVNPATDCTPVPCQQQACANHICQPSPDAAQNDHACGSGLVCSAGACISSCGNGITDVADGEVCDDANLTNGDGCNNNCQFSCSNPVNDCLPASVCNVATCTPDHICAPAADPTQDDQTCGANKVCSGGACINACGNKIVDPGEQCDDGNTVNGDGCDNDCTFSCVDPTTDCGAAPICEKEVCDGNHACQPATDATQNGTTCATSKVCTNGACVIACGNGVVDPGEQCEPPNTATCDANCQNQCDPDGSWASLLSVNVTWAGDGVFLTKGTGTISVWSLITTSQAGTTNSVLPCGIAVPGFSSALASYFIKFPTSLFDNSFLTAADMPATFSSLKAGATYTTTQPFTSLIGMTAPVTGAWPAAAGVTSADQDKDGQLGVTADTDAPVEAALFNATTADHIDLALRQTTALNGTLTDCTHLSGAATISHQDSHVLGCDIKNGANDTACTAVQYGFLDQHRPVYVPGASTFQATKMSNAPTCANVRNQFPPYPADP